MKKLWEFIIGYILFVIGIAIFIFPIAFADLDIYIKTTLASAWAINIIFSLTSD